MAEELPDLFRPVILVQKRDFLACAGVNTVEYRLAQRPAVFIHRQAIAAEHVAADTRDVLGIDYRVAQKSS